MQTHGRKHAREHRFSREECLFLFFLSSSSALLSTLSRSFAPLLMPRRRHRRDDDEVVVFVRQSDDDDDDDDDVYVVVWRSACANHGATRTARRDPEEVRKAERFRTPSSSSFTSSRPRGLLMYVYQIVGVFLSRSIPRILKRPFEFRVSELVTSSKSSKARPRTRSSEQFSRLERLSGL